MTPPIPAPYLRGLGRQLDRCDSIAEATRLIRAARQAWEQSTGEVIEPEPVTDPDQYDAEQRAARC